MYTDNNPLTYILTTAKLDATGQRWIAALGTYNFQIYYQSGKSNRNADALSRIPLKETSLRDYDLIDGVVVNSIIKRSENIAVPQLEDFYVSKAV